MNNENVGTDRPQRCPIELMMEFIGGKWKPVILYHLSVKTQRFGELQRLIPHVSQRMLTQHLRELEEHGIVHREIYKEIPPKVEYSLTEFGQTLLPILNMMNDWAELHITSLLVDDLVSVGDK